MFCRVMIFCNVCFFTCIEANASTETSWGRIEACIYEKNKSQELLNDVNYISKELANKHSSGSSDYSELDKILTALFAPHPGPISEDGFKKTRTCSAQMRISLIKQSASHIKDNNNDWLICYQKSFSEDHAVIKAV